MTSRRNQLEDYYYLDALHNGHGPVSRDVIRKLIHKTNVSIWRPGLTDWTLASNVAEFSRVHAVAADPSLAEMISLCHDILGDGVVTESEAGALRNWLQTHPHAGAAWPGNVIATRLTEIYQDGAVSPAEQTDLKLLLNQLLAHNPDPRQVVAAAPDSPFDKPLPHIGFHARSFCFAGKFVFGSLERCHGTVTARHGLIHHEPAWNTHYVVVGALDPGPSLLAKAQKLKKLGATCKIVAEEHWTKFVRPAPAT